MKPLSTILHLAVLCLAVCAKAQEAPAVSTAYLSKVSSRAEQLDEKLDRQSTTALKRLQKQEARIRARLAKTDSLKAAMIFASAQEHYTRLKQRLQSGNAQPYISSLDTLVSSLKFLQQNPRLLSSAKDADRRLANALRKMDGVEDRFQSAEEIKKFLIQRRQYLQEQLGQLGFARELKQLNKQVYYYSEQLEQYKDLLKDHTRAEKKAIEVLSKTKLFRDFMRRNSQLASLFRLPGDPDDPVSQANLAGLQTRAQVNGLIQQQLASGGANAQQQFTQNIQQAQGQLNELKNRIGKLGKNSSDDILPEGFRPNNQKTKSFLQRLELGTNIQSQKSNGYFPVTSDIGLSLGYKLNDKSIIGIGASYKMGWGQNIRHINITHQGVGLRSFVDWKIRGSLWVSGGYEMNYRSEFTRIDVLKDRSAWQQSGLIGMSKVISLKTKFFKNTKLQLLWDFLSYEQIPRGQPVVLRVGYNFK